MGSALYQYLAVLSGNLGTLAYRISVGWMGIALSLYDSDKSPLPTGRIEMYEQAWISSMLGIGGIVGTIAAGWLADKIGRKYTLLMAALPQIASYLLIIYAQNVYFVIVSRFFTGCVGGIMFVVIPVMVAEVAEDRSRGGLGVLLVLQGNAGSLLGFLIAHFLHYELGLWLCLLFPALFLSLYSFMPETPNYLMKTNRIEDAEKSLRFYRNMKSNNSNSKSFEDFEHELLRLKMAHEVMHPKNDDTNSMTKWKEPLKIRDFFNRSFVMSCVLIAGHEINGVFTMTNYASVIFSESGSTLSPGISSIIVAAIQFIGSYVSCLLVDRLGRKLLMVTSFAGTAISQIILATYMLIDTCTDFDVEPYNSVPIVSFSAMIFFAACGAIPVPFVVIAEILPEKIRSVGITCCLVISWGLTFVLFEIFPIISSYHMHASIYMYAVFCSAMLIYILVAVPETKGKSLDDILLLINSKTK